MDKMKIAISSFREGQAPLVLINSIIACYAIGIYVSANLMVLHKYLLFLLSVNFLILIITIQKRSAMAVVVLLVFAMGIGMENYALQTKVVPSDIRNFYGKNISFTAIVEDGPKISEGSYGHKIAMYTLSLREGSFRDPKTHRVLKRKLSGKIRFYQNATDKFTPVAVGAVVKGSGEARRLRAYHNFGGINKDNIYAVDGLCGSMADFQGGLKLIQPPSKYNIAARAEVWRAKINEVFNQKLPDNAGLLMAMVFGGYNNIDSEVVQDYVNTGIVHILSVSGSHIALLIGFLLLILRSLHCPQLFSLGIIILIITMYVVLCGAVPPVIRAAIMGVLALVALIWNRYYQAAQLLSLTALGLLLYNPLLLFHISFQLSFVSTAGLIYIMPQLLKIPVGKNIPYLIRASIALTISAQLAVMPFMAYYFNNLSLVSVIANLLITPILELVIILALLSAVAVFFLPIVVDILLYLANYLLNASNAALKMMAHWRWSVIYLPTFTWYMTLLFYLCIYIGCHEELRRRSGNILQKYKIHSLWIIIILIGYVCGYFYLNRDLEIHFLDVGQGDAALVITPHHKAIMIDTGGSGSKTFDIGKAVDMPHLKHCGVHKLEGLILSHVHEDHSGGAKYLVHNLPIKRILIAKEGVDKYAQVLGISGNKKLLSKIHVVKENDSFVIDGVKFTVVHAANIHHGNEASQVVRIDYGKFSALFTGDLTSSGEEEMLHEGKLRPVTVLKVGHHGSHTSSSEAFLKSLAPKYAVISDGMYNKFAHPRPEVLKRLQQLPTKVLRTDCYGEIVLTTNGHKVHYRTFFNEKEAHDLEIHR